MRLVITENITLDGVIEATGGWFGPESGESESSDIVAELQAMMRNEDGLLLGRKTFEEFRGLGIFVEVVRSKHHQTDAGILNRMETLDRSFYTLTADLSPRDLDN